MQNKEKKNPFAKIEKWIKPNGDVVYVDTHIYTDDEADVLEDWIDYAHTIDPERLHDDAIVQILEHWRNKKRENLIKLRGSDMFITNKELKREFRDDHPFYGIARQLTKTERMEYKEATGIDLSPCYVARKWDDDEDSFFNSYGSSRIYIGDNGY